MGGAGAPCVPERVKLNACSCERLHGDLTRLSLLCSEYYVWLQLLEDVVSLYQIATHRPSYAVAYCFWLWIFVSYATSDFIHAYNKDQKHAPSYFSDYELTVRMVLLFLSLL